MLHIITETCCDVWFGDAGTDKEMEMLRFSFGVSRMSRIRNSFISRTVQVEKFGEKVREARLRWIGWRVDISGKGC